MKRESYNERDAGKVYLWALLIPIVVSLILSLALSGSPQDENNRFLVLDKVWFICLLQILSAAILVGIYYFYTSRNKISYKACGITQKPNYLMVIICIVVGITLCLFTDKFITIIAIGLDKIGININSSMNIPLSNFGEYTLSILMIALLPAVTEELVYRGIILNGLRGLGKWSAILLSALAFSLMHGNIAQLPYTFLLGIVLGYVMFETSSLILCMTIHFFNNATVITQMYITQTSTIPESLSASYVIEAILLLIAAVGIVVLAFYLISLIKKQLAQKEVQAVSNNSESEEEISTKQNKKLNQKGVLTQKEMVEQIKREIQLPNTKSQQDKSGIILLCVGYGVAICLILINLI